MTHNAAPPQAHLHANNLKNMALPTLDLTLQFGDVPNAARHRAALPRAFVNRCIRSALAHDAEMTVRIVDAEEGQALNSSYRKKNYATNVLTFDYAQAPMVMADLVLCAPVVAAEAKEQGKSLQEHYAHLLIHGALHAQGYDHETSEKDAIEMETLEMLIMASLGLPCPY
jgi:probable rRNA maturation factor